MLPKIKDDLREWELDIKPSVSCIVVVQGYNEIVFSFGRYLHSISEWQIEGIPNTGGRFKVLEWFPLPTPGTGNKPE